MFLAEALLAERGVDLVAVFWCAEREEQWVYRGVQWEDKHDEPSVRIPRHLEIGERQKLQDYNWCPASCIRQHDEEESGGKKFRKQSWAAVEIVPNGEFTIEKVQSCCTSRSPDRKEQRSVKGCNQK